VSIDDRLTLASVCDCGSPDIVVRDGRRSSHASVCGMTPYALALMPEARAGVLRNRLHHDPSTGIEEDQASGDDRLSIATPARLWAPTSASACESCRRPTFATDLHLTWALGVLVTREPQRTLPAGRATSPVP
jgi:hypothetical protein